MKTAESCIEPMMEKVEQYCRTSYELVRLKATLCFAKLVGYLLHRLLVAFSFFMAIVVLSIGLAVWLGELLGQLYFGLFCVGGLYALLGFIIFISGGSKLSHKISSIIISKILN